MHRTMVLAVFILVLAAASFGQTTASKGEGGSEGFEAALPSDGLIRLEVRSGDVRILGGDEDKIRVRYEGRESARGGEVEVKLARAGKTGDLSIQGGPRNGFQIILQVPRRSNLRVRMPFGDLAISAITGDKDIEVHAGDLTVEVGESTQYAHVDASVMSGELSAGPFGVNTGGLFRSFAKAGSGTYRLHAHLGAGDLVLKRAIRQ
jgi:hypothetical protein